MITKECYQAVKARIEEVKKKKKDKIVRVL